MLTAVPGTWAGVGNTYKYQWQRDTGSGFANITGATAATYTLALADVGAKIRVTGHGHQRRRHRLGALRGDRPIATNPPVNSAVPAVTGTPKRAMTLTTNAGSWSGAGQHLHLPVAARHGPGFAEHRRRRPSTRTCSSRTTPARRIRAKVTATNPDANVSAFSVAVGPVADAKPVNTVLPASRAPRSAPRP